MLSFCSWFYFCRFKQWCYLRYNEGKVHIFWEGHKILRNLHLTFDWHHKSKVKISPNFVAFSENMNFNVQYCSTNIKKCLKSWRCLSRAHCISFLPPWKNLSTCLQAVTIIMVGHKRFCTKEVPWLKCLKKYPFYVISFLNKIEG